MTRIALCTALFTILISSVLEIGFCEDDLFAYDAELLRNIRLLGTTNDRKQLNTLPRLIEKRIESVPVDMWFLMSDRQLQQFASAAQPLTARIQEFLDSDSEVIASTAILVAGRMGHYASDMTDTLNRIATDDANPRNIRQHALYSLFLITKPTDSVLDSELMPLFLRFYHSPVNVSEPSSDLRAVLLEAEGLTRILTASGHTKSEVSALRRVMVDQENEHDSVVAIALLTNMGPDATAAAPDLVTTIQQRQDRQLQRLAARALASVLGDSVKFESAMKSIAFEEDTAVTILDDGLDLIETVTRENAELADFITNPDGRLADYCYLILNRGNLAQKRNMLRVVRTAATARRLLEDERLLQVLAKLADSKDPETEELATQIKTRVFRSRKARPENEQVSDTEKPE